MLALADALLVSLQATWIRNSLLHALRSSTNISTRQISNNVVYEYPSIHKLASLLSRLANTETLTETNGDTETGLMLEMVEKYSSEFPTHVPQAGRCCAYANHVVLVTGTTGGYGCSILNELLKSPEVSLVYALNRKSNIPIHERQMAAFQDRDMDASILDSPKVVLLESNLHEDKLGLPDDTYEEVWALTTSKICAYMSPCRSSRGSHTLSIMVSRRLVE